MKKLDWHFHLGLALIGLSIVFYAVLYFVFGNMKDISYWFLSNLAFAFVQVLLVTLIVDNLLGEREKKIMLEKLNMVIGVFFTELGTKLLRVFAGLDGNIDRVRADLMVTTGWTDAEFANVKSKLKQYEYAVTLKQSDAESLLALLRGERDFLLRLLENPILLEHETFTDLLQAVFHLAEELAGRPGFDNLPASDFDHMSGDAKRAYGLLVIEWLEYMKHLKSSYPYLFSLAMRMNPFDANASPVIH